MFLPYAFLVVDLLHSDTQLEDAPNNELFSELVQIYAAMDGMCDNDRSKARERLEEIAPILNLNLTDIDSYMKNELGMKV